MSTDMYYMYWQTASLGQMVHQQATIVTEAITVWQARVLNYIVGSEPEKKWCAKYQYQAELRCG